MARPERNTVDYFPYYCDEGEKMYYIDERYGNDGFATFIKILTHLAKTDYHYLDLSKKTTQMFLSAKCKVSVENLNSIVTDLAELGKFNLVLWNENKIIWCQDFIDSIQDAYKKRNNECISLDGLLITLDGLGIRKLSNLLTKGGVKPQSKVDYSKEDKIKEKENKLIEQFKKIASQSFIENNCSYGNDFKKQWFILIQTKKWRKKEQSAINASLKLLMKYDEEFALALVEKSISGDYQGVVFADTDNHYQKYLNSKNGTTQSNEDKSASRARLKSLAIAVLTNQNPEMRG